ncbi:hypothetical protein [Kingella denitrificans]
MALRRHTRAWGQLVAQSVAMQKAVPPAFISVSPHPKSSLHFVGQPSIQSAGCFFRIYSPSVPILWNRAIAAAAPSVGMAAQRHEHRWKSRA